MGYGYYERERPDGKVMKRGYYVQCKCHKRGCNEKIDRGLSFLCYNCTEYYCSKHLTYAFDKKDEAIEADCFAGKDTQVCFKCAKELEKAH